MASVSSDHGYDLEHADDTHGDHYGSERTSRRLQCYFLQGLAPVYSKTLIKVS